MPKIIDHDARRIELAIAACEAIYRFGMDKLTMKDVGQVAGYTTGVLTHYFANKDELMLAALDYAWLSIQEKMEIRLSQEEPDYIGFLSELMPISDENRIAVVVWFHFWLRGLTNTSLAERHRVNREAWLVKLTAVLTTMQARGEIGAGIDISTEVVGVDAFINGIALRAIINPDEWPTERQLSELRRYLKRLR